MDQEEGDPYYRHGIIGKFQDLEDTANVLKSLPSGSRAYESLQQKTGFRNALEFAEAYVGKNDHKCTFCGKVFNRTIILKRHVMNHSGFKDYQCTKCPKTFVNKDFLHAHQKTHADGNFPCKCCNKTFRNPEYVRRHERRHSQKTKFDCEICGCTFASRDNIKAHIMGVHFYRESGKIVRKKFTCRECQQVFWKKSKYLQHMKRHEDRTKMCFYCGKKISDRQNLKRHCRRSHPGQPIMLPRQRRVKPSDTAANREIQIIWEEYHPPQSPEPTSVPSVEEDGLQVIAHEFQTAWEFAAAHVTEGTVQCCFCRKIFRRTVMLRRHMMEHSGLKEAKCPECHKVFAHHDALHEHMVCHVKEEHPCIICGKVFQNANYCRKHIRRTHSTLPKFPCSVCKSIFTREEYLEDHVLTFHNSKTSTIMKKIKERLRKVTQGVAEEEMETLEVLEDPEIIMELSDFPADDVFTVETIEAEPQEIPDEASEEPPDEAFWEDEVEGKPFAKVEVFEPEFLEQDSSEPAQDDLPPESFETQADFINYYLRDEDRTCRFCNKTFNWFFQLKQHIVIHSGIKEFSCPKCKKGFMYENLMLSHLATVHTKERHPCNKCGKVFRNADYLKRHENRHKYSIMRYECTFCGIVFDLRDTLKIHLTSHYKKEHGSTTRTKYSCEFCDKTFTNKRLHEKHRQQHNENVEEAAPENEMTFDVNKVKTEKIFCIDGIINEDNNASEPEGSSEVNDNPPDPRHYETAKEFVNEYMRRIDFTCYICGKVFPEHRYLRKHVLSHAGIKDYKCPKVDCSEMFGSQEAVDEHVKESHMQHICNLCGREFTQLAYLKRHLERHRKIKYECEICSREYSSRYGLKCHFRNVHYDNKTGKFVRKKYYCKDCDEYVWKKSILEQHKRRHVRLHMKSTEPEADNPVLKQDTSTNTEYKSAKDFARAHVKRGEKKCKFCDKVFSRPSLLKLHIMNHYGFRDYKCPKCPKDFVKEHLLNTHFDRVHATECHACKLCGKQFRNIDYLRRHLRRHTMPRKFECEHCGMKFTALYTLKCHILNVHFRKETGTVSKTRFYCKQCKRVFWKKSKFEGHQRIHARHTKASHWTLKVGGSPAKDSVNVKVEVKAESSYSGVIPVQVVQVTKIPIPTQHSFKTAEEFVNAYATKKDRVCCFCERMFKRPALLRRHMVNHSGLRDYKCPQCEKDFAHEDLLHVHMETVHAPDRYPCRICGKVFRRPDRLNNHMRTHDKMTIYKCDLCEKQFTTDSGLRKHIKRKHLMESPKAKDNEVKFTCEICKMTFVKEAAFEKHKSVHMDKSVLCFYCGKSICDRSNLRMHSRKYHGGLPVDDKDGPPVCTVCNALFEDLQGLKDHFVIHGEYPFECGSCGSAFKRQQEFREHIQINHFSEETFPCYMCGKVFDDPHSMKQHRATHLSLPNPFSCDLCSKGFSTAFLLTKHKEMHHPFENFF